MQKKNKEEYRRINKIKKNKIKNKKEQKIKLN